MGLIYSIKLRFNFHYQQTNIILIMIRIVSRAFLFQKFSVQNKTQNFFDMNPIYPDFGQKNFDIYNSQRKKINVIDQYVRQEERDKWRRRLIKNRIFSHKYEKFRRYSGGRKVVIDPQTKLAIGINSDFDDYVKIFKRDFFMDKNAKSEFKQTMLKLIAKFKCKSQPQLIRLFRISIANRKSKYLLDKIRGQVMEQAILKTAQNMKKYEIFSQSKKQQDERQQQFQKILKQIDQKIKKAQQSLLFDHRGVPKVLSKYDSKYGWMQQRQSKIDQNYDLNVSQGIYQTVSQQAIPIGEDPHDWSLKSRINRLYFLKRIQYLKGERQQFKDLQFYQQIPLNLRQREKIMNQLAVKYKQNDAIQVPDIHQIYSQIDAVVDKVYVKVSASNPNGQDKSKPKQEHYDRSPDQSEFLWSNISAQQIICDSLYNTDAIKNIVLHEKDLVEVSPSSHTELSLGRIPINLFRHSQLDSIGMFNEYRQKLAQNLMRVEQTDFQPYFEDFSLEQAQRKYRRTFKDEVQKKTSSVAFARRKTAYARAKIKAGTGIVTINNKPIQDYFGDTYHRVQALKPLVITDSSGIYDVKLDVAGGGCKGQAQCMAYALARALMKINPQHREVLYYFGLVGYDYRKKQPKKTNKYTARISYPYVRR